MFKLEDPETRMREGLANMEATTDERTSVLTAFDIASDPNSTKEEILMAISSIPMAINRARRRTESNRRTDPTRRKLVGARVSLDLYTRCAMAAANRGVSLYRWCVDAFKAALRT